MDFEHRKHLRGFCISNLHSSIMYSQMSKINSNDISVCVPKVD